MKMNQNEFLVHISNRLILFNVVLIPFVLLYYFGIQIKNFLYDCRILKIKRLPKPVVSIGNISIGGSGKTALVLSLIEKYNNVCVLTRGYKSKVTKEKLYPQEVTSHSTEFFGDEPSLISSYMKTGKVVIDPDRHRGGLYAQNKNSEIDFYILDDGYQHRKLHRDLDLVVFDLDTFVQSLMFNKFFSIFSLLPIGKYRETLSSLFRADFVLVSKWKHLNSNQVNKALDIVKKFNKKIVFLESELSEVTNLSGDKITTGNVILFSGLGKPSVFEEDIIRCFPKIRILKHKVFNDHYKYKINDLQDLVHKAKESGAVLLCTEKDFIKVKEFNLGPSIDRFYFARQILKIDATVFDAINKLIK